MAINSPAYLSTLINNYKTASVLHSSNINPMQIPRIKIVSGTHAFRCAALMFWNTFPAIITSTNSLDSYSSMKAVEMVERAAANKTSEYTELVKTHTFIPIAVEMGGSWNELELIGLTELGRRIAGVTQEPWETQFLFQRMSISVQRGNAVAFENTLSSGR